MDSYYDTTDTWSSESQEDSADTSDSEHSESESDMNDATIPSVGQTISTDDRVTLVLS